MLGVAAEKGHKVHPTSRSQLVHDTPLLSLVEPREAPELTTMQKLRAKVPALPFFLNPRRLPFNAPYNYLAIVGLPILLPAMIVLVLYRFAAESRKSRARVSELDKGWDMEEGDGRGERHRIERLVRSVMMSVGEERVDEERSFIGSAHHDDEGVVQVEEASQTATPNRSPLQSSWAEGNKHQQPALLAAQTRMVRALNDLQTLPRLEKRWAYFDDVINGESMSRHAGKESTLILYLARTAHAIIVW